MIRAAYLLLAAASVLGPLRAGASVSDFKFHTVPSFCESSLCHGDHFGKGEISFREIGTVAGEASIHGSIPKRKGGPTCDVVDERFAFNLRCAGVRPVSVSVLSATRLQATVNRDLLSVMSERKFGNPIFSGGVSVLFVEIVAGVLPRSKVQHARRHATTLAQPARGTERSEYRTRQQRQKERG